MKKIIAFIFLLPALMLAQPTPIGGGGLPSQAGNSGKFLTTNGSTPSWGTPSGGGDVVASGTLTAASLIIGAGTTTVAAASTGANVLNALAVAVGTDGAFVVKGGALGTPISGTVTNLTGTASININGTVGATTPNTGAFTTVTATGAISTGTGSGAAGYLVLNEGTAAALVANAFVFYAPTDVAAGGLGYVPPSAAATGFMLATNAAGVMTITHVASTGAGDVVRATAPTVTAPIVLLSASLGTDDTYSASSAITGLNAGATIAQWEIVYLGGSSTWLLADANGSSTYPACGMAVAAYSNTNPAIVITRGTVRNDAWNWTPGGRLYMSATPGGLTQTAPATGGDQVQDVGFALTADIAYVDFDGVYLTVQE